MKNNKEPTKKKELKKEIEQLKYQISDLININKRLEKESLNKIIHANENFAKDLLLIVDSLDNAKNFIKNIKNSNDSKLKEIEKGFDLILEQFSKLFQKHEIKEIKTDVFDPNVHEAILQVEKENIEDEKNKIVKVFQKGYKYKNKLLRPSKVSVSK